MGPISSTDFVDLVPQTIASTNTTIDNLVYISEAIATGYIQILNSLALHICSWKTCYACSTRPDSSSPVLKVTRPQCGIVTPQRHIECNCLRPAAPECHHVDHWRSRCRFSCTCCMFCHVRPHIAFELVHC